MNILKNLASAGIPSAASRQRSRWVVLVGIVLAATLLYSALRGVNWRGLWIIIARAKPGYLALGATTTMGALLVRAFRWRALLSNRASVPLFKVFQANSIGYLGNYFLPMRMGELIRSALLGRHQGLDTSFVLATALSERLLDAVTLVLVGAVAVSSVHGLPPEIRGALRFMGLAAAVGLVGLVAAPRMETWICRCLAKAPVSAGVASRLQTVVRRFLLGMRAGQRPQTAIRFALLTAFVWLAEAFALTLIGNSLGLPLTMVEALTLIAALGLASAVPSTPGYIGVYQFVSVCVLPLFGYSREQALACILVSQAVAYAVVTVAGTCSLLALGTSAPSASAPPPLVVED